MSNIDPKYISKEQYEYNKSVISKAQVNFAMYSADNDTDNYPTYVVGNGADQQRNHIVEVPVKDNQTIKIKKDKDQKNLNHFGYHWKFDPPLDDRMTNLLGRPFTQYSSGISILGPVCEAIDKIIAQEFDRITFSGEPPDTNVKVVIYALSEAGMHRIFSALQHKDRRSGQYKYATRMWDKAQDWKFVQVTSTNDTENARKFSEHEGNAILVSNVAKASTSITIAGARTFIRFVPTKHTDAVQTDGRISRIYTHKHLGADHRNVKQFYLIPTGNRVRTNEFYGHTCDSILYEFMKSQYRYHDTIARMMWNTSLTKKLFRLRKPAICRRDDGIECNEIDESSVSVVVERPWKVQKRDLNIFVNCMHFKTTFHAKTEFVH